MLPLKHWLVWSPSPKDKQVSGEDEGGCLVAGKKTEVKDGC